VLGRSKRSFEHDDPSLSNLVLDRKTKHGVLNDWDLSYRRSMDRERHSDGKRTGTILFTVLDILDDPYWAGRVGRLPSLS